MYFVQFVLLITFAARQRLRAASAGQAIVEGAAR